MKSGVFLCYRLFIVFCLLSCFALSPAHAQWTSEKIAENRLSLDTVWGTSDDNMYAVSFAGKVFHKDETGWSDISGNLFTDASATLLYLPYGVWGTSDDNVYVVGTTIDYNNGEDALTMGVPFIFRYNGVTWSKISLTGSPVYQAAGGKFSPNWLAGIWGTSANDMYFTGGKFTGGELNKDPVTGGIVLHYNASSDEWTGEVGVGDLLNDNYDDPVTNPMPMVNEIIGMNGHIYAVGLKGLILHKNIGAGNWDIMPTESTTLNFFRIWGEEEDDLFAVGFNSSNAAAVIYRYDGTAWTAMTLPTLRTGYIAALWGIWGESSSNVHCVGNVGAALYYDGNPGNIWKMMISGTSTSLNGAWGTAFNNVYAAGEDGRLYHFTGGIRTSAVGAYPRECIAPEMVEFTDKSIGEVDRWEWDFGEGTLASVAPTADLDYRILVTAVKGSSMNGARIVVLDNGVNVTGESLETVNPLPATADLGDNTNTDNISEGVILITAKPGSKANAYSVHVLKSALNEPAGIYRYQKGIYLKVNGNTTLGEMADLLESLTDLVASAVPDNADVRWFDNPPPSSSVQFKGGQNYTINVRIDSGVSTQSDIAAMLKTHDQIVSAVADSPATVWVRGAEQTGTNKYGFAGGLDNANIYVNTDTSIDNYFMAAHTYETAGDYTAKLTVHKPAVPATAEILVEKDARPGILTYDQGMILASIPGTSMNGVTIAVRDGGPGCTPGIEWDEDTITLTVKSGITTQQEAANLLMTHPQILAAVPSVAADPWYSSSDYGEDSTTFYNGLSEGTENSEIAVKVFEDNPLDFAVINPEGVKKVKAVFRETAAPEIKDRIVKWMWYFNYTDEYEQGTDIIAVYNADDPVTFTYDSLGTYNVKLAVLLDDNSPFKCVKYKAVTVKSSDEDKSSIEGGSGLDNAGGCFIGTAG